MMGRPFGSDADLPLGSDAEALRWLKVIFRAEVEVMERFLPIGSPRFADNELGWFSQGHLETWQRALRRVEQALRRPRHSLPTPEKQDIHTQPGESETRLQDVRRCEACAAGRMAGFADSVCSECWHRQDKASAILAERARIRAAVEGDLALLSSGYGRGLRLALTYLDAGEGSAGDPDR